MTSRSFDTGAAGNRQTVSERVLTAVAEREGVDPIEFDVPLYEAIDPEALDTLFSRAECTPRRLEFTYYGYRISVDGQGAVLAREQDELSRRC